MDRFDEVFSVLTEDQGWSEENARKIMVYCAEQGMNPLEAAARFVGGMAGLPTVDMRKSFFNPWNQFPKKPQPQKGLPKPPSSRLPTRALPPSTVDAVVSKPQIPQQPPAPKPAFSSVGTTTVKPQQGPALSTRVAPAPQFGGSPQAQDIKRLNQLTKGPIGDKTIQKPVVSSGRMGTPQGPKLSTNVAPKPKFATSMTPAPKPAFNAPKPAPSLFGKLKNIATGIRSAAGPAIAQSIGLELSTKLAQSAGRPGQSKLSRLGALPGRSEYAPVYKTPLNTDAFEKPQQKTSEPKKSEVTGDALYLPRTPKSQPVQKAAEPVKREAPKLSAAAKDFDKTFAAARAAGEKEFTWRGKRYNTKYKGE